MKCLICGLGPAPEHGSVTVYRQNAKGKIGVWACRAHRTAPVDAEEQDLVDTLEGAAHSGRAWSTGDGTVCGCGVPWLAGITHNTPACSSREAKA